LGVNWIIARRNIRAEESIEKKEEKPHE